MTWIPYDDADLALLEVEAKERVTDEWALARIETLLQEVRRLRDVAIQTEALREENAVLKEQIDELEDEVSDLEHDNSNLQDKNDVLRDEIRDLENELAVTEGEPA